MERSDNSHNEEGQKDIPTDGVSSEHPDIIRPLDTYNILAEAVAIVQNEARKNFVDIMNA